MITAPVTKEQLVRWKRLWTENAPAMQPNSITGAELDAYFREKYAPKELDDMAFQAVVRYNLKQRYGGPAAAAAKIACYLTDGVYVGIDLNTGFFHVECKQVEKCVSVYDDLFVKRGLEQDELQNYVLVGQYLELTFPHERSTP